MISTSLSLHNWRSTKTVIIILPSTLSTWVTAGTMFQQITTKTHWNTVIYSGTTWTTVTLLNGNFSYGDISGFIEQSLGSNKHAELCKRREYVSIDLKNPITMLANAESPKKSGYKFVVDSSDESHPFDGYNAYFEFEFWISIQFRRMKNHYFGSHEQESTIVIWNKLVSIWVSFTSQELISCTMHQTLAKKIMRLYIIWPQNNSNAMKHFLGKSPFCITLWISGFSENVTQG